MSAVRLPEPPPRRTNASEGVPGRWERPALMPGATPRTDTVDGKKLLVGYGISLTGEIAPSDLLLVEGEINGKLNDSKLLEINETGKFIGEALVEVAQISGLFEGTLTVRDRLVINPTGRVSGLIRYARIEILAGGTISGDIQVVAAIEDVADFSDPAPEPEPEVAIETEEPPVDSVSVSAD